MDFKHRYIAIEGNIGAGKTSLVELLSSKLKANILLEEFENNPFLASFYKEPEKFALSTELFFLSERYEQQKAFFKTHQGLTISDYYLAKCVSFAQATLKGHELALYQKIYKGLSHQLPNPDIILYLQRPIPYLTEKIKQRGRVYEQQITEDYLNEVEQAYRLTFEQVKHLPVIVVNCYDIDFYGDGVLDNLILRILTKNWPAGLQYLDFKGL